MNRTPLPELARTLRTLGDYGHRLAPVDATPEQLHVVGEALEHARRLLAAAQRPRSVSGCREHPDGPVDPADGDRCLLCRTRVHQATPTGQAVPDPVVARAVAGLGTDEAARRYGPRALTRALAAATRGSHTYPPHLKGDPMSAPERPLDGAPQAPAAACTSSEGDLT